MKHAVKIIVIGIVIVSLLLVAIFFIIHGTTKSSIYNNVEVVPHTQTALIPGASVTGNGQLSPVLQDRADAAIILYNKRKVDNILVSGDNSTSTYNEVNPVQNYLIAHKVLPQDIFLDYAGFDTYSTMYRARDIFLVGSTTIVSQNFHLPRALYIAHNLGVVAFGFNADNGHYLAKNYIREFLANSKAIFNLVFHTKPKYLGKVEPVTKN
jgi:SanA protein